MFTTFGDSMGWRCEGMDRNVARYRVLIQQCMDDLVGNEAKAIEYLRIKDRLSYRCPTSSVTAIDFSVDAWRMRLLGAVDNFVHGDDRARIRETYERFQESVLSKREELWSHVDQCPPCKTYHDLYFNCVTVLAKYRGQLDELLRKPFGLDAWRLTLMSLRRDGYVSFNDYLRARVTRSS